MSGKETEVTRSGAPRRRTAKATPPADPAWIFTELHAIVSEPRPPEAVKRGLLLVERAFRPRSAFAVVHDSAFDRLNVAASRGRADSRVCAATPGEGTVGLAFSTLSPQVEGDGALVAVPMIAFGRPVGALVLIGGTYLVETGPGPEELARLLAIGSACGASTEAAKSRNDAERRARELETAAERLREGDRTRDALLSHLSHELRTPLTTIKGYLAMGLKGRLGELTPKQHNAFAVCERNTDRLLRLINDLLLTARLQAGKMTLDPKPLGLRSVVDEAMQFLSGDAEIAGVKMSLRAPSGEVFVRGNRDRLVEAFMHLMERGLRGKRERASIEVTLAPRGRVGGAEIELHGIQVPGPEVGRLFEAFRPDSGSASIGLSIAQQIVELHGGALGAEQKPDGLVFQLALPLFAGVVASASERPAPRRGGEILIVEDDDDCRNALIDVLSAERYSVRAFAEGRSALEQIRKVPPSLVLLDLRIPGVDGAALIKAVREGSREKGTPIYVISGAIDSQAGADLAWGERVDGVFEKPLNFPYLLERVREYVVPEVESNALA